MLNWPQFFIGGEYDSLVLRENDLLLICVRTILFFGILVDLDLFHDEVVHDPD